MERSVIIKRILIAAAIIVAVVLVFRIIMIPFWGDPVKKMQYSSGAKKHLEEQYPDERFKVESVEYNRKREDSYYALAISRDHETVGTFTVNITEKDGRTVYSDNYMQKRSNRYDAEKYKTLADLLGYTDADASVSGKTGDTVTVTLKKEYAREALADLYEIIKLAKKESVTNLVTVFSGKKNTTTFNFKNSIIYEINEKGDILKKCTPSVAEK